MTIGAMVIRPRAGWVRCQVTLRMQAATVHCWNVFVFFVVCFPL